MDWFRNVPNVIRSQSSQSDHSANNSATTGRNSTGLSDKNFNNHDDMSSLNRTATKFHSDNRRNSKDSTNNNNDQFGTTALALSRFMSATSENRRKSSVSREELTCKLININRISNLASKQICNECSAKNEVASRICTECDSEFQLRGKKLEDFVTKGEISSTTQKNIIHGRV